MNVPSPADATPAYKAAAMRSAVSGLRDNDPLASAAVPLIAWQRAVFYTILALTVVSAVISLRVTLAVFTGICTTAYLAAIVDRVVIFRRGLRRDSIVSISDEEALAIPDGDLPGYTVLVPAYNEPEVVGDLIKAMSALIYPKDKLQILLLLEEDDDVTIDAARDKSVGDAATILLVPAADPRTKPKACNYGLHFSTGDIVTIFDAEDHPDPLQLRRAVAAFRQLPANTACVQAKLAFHNGRQNLLTGWFTADYCLWFGYLLPGLMRSKAPIPLGGTSNHFRRDILDDIGAWDPFNVTEDADLGVRLAARGYTTAVLDSETLEEANSDPINWIRQRSRWYKGYLQTFLVHTRRPVQLWRDLGAVSFLRFAVLMAGTPIISVLNLVFWFITLMWFLGQPALIESIFPPVIYFPALVCMVIGNIATITMGLIACREAGHDDLLVPCLTVPLYWVMMSVAATKGCWQMITNPSYWEKTFHGLATESEPK